ncbi:MAG: phytanoyl-CoA dioxygenase family protein, partial [Francisellaceae bacterium]
KPLWLLTSKISTYQLGYIKLTDFLNVQEKQQLMRWCDQLEALPETSGKWMKYFETNIHGDRSLCRIECFLDYHAGLSQLVRGEKTINLLSNLMGEKATLFKEKINFKLPGGNGFRPHQDAPAFISFNQRYHITMMLVIDDATLQNGCLQLVEGGHYKNITLDREADGSIRTDIAKSLPWKAIECKTGDLILFDSYIPHYSEANLSDKPRRAAFVTYNRLSDGGSKRDAYFADKREKFPPDCEKDPNKDYSAGAVIYNLANPLPAKNL